MKNSLRTSLVAGAIGVVLGAASMQAAQQILGASIAFSYSRPSIRLIREQANVNYADRQEKTRVNVTRTKADK